MKSSQPPLGSRPARHPSGGLLAGISAFLVLGLLAASAAPAAAARPRLPRLRFSFTKSFYSEKEPAVARVVVTNPTKNPLTGALVQVEVFNRLRLGRQGPLPSESLEHRELLPADLLPPGRKQLIFSRKAAEMGISEGAYPVTARLIWQGREVAKSKTTLIIVNPRVGNPLSVALVWDLHDRTHMSPSGVFWDRGLQKKEFDLLGTHLWALRRHRNVQVSANLTPLLTEQIRNTSRGYRFVAKGSTKPLELSASSRDARRARLLLDQYGALINRGSIELVPAPYAYPSLVSLGQRGWTEDIKDQTRYGWRISSDALGLEGKFSGLYIPGLKLNSATVPVIVSMGIEFFLLDDTYFIRSPNHTGSPYQPHRVEDPDRRRVTVFFKNSAPTNILTQRRPPAATVQRLLGALAEVYLSKPGAERVVVIAPGPDFHPDRRLLNLLYGRLERTPWLAATGLVSAARSLPAATRPLALPETVAAPGYLQNRYYVRLAQARTRFRYFAAALSKTNPLGVRLRTALFVAESSDWTRSRTDPRLINMGLKYVRYINQTIAAGYAKVSMPTRQSVTLTGQSGKIPVSISNGNAFPMKVTLVLSSRGFDFPNGRRQSITLKPKENFFTFPVVARSPGSSRVTLSLKSGGETFARNAMTVKAAYLSRTFWAILGLATAGLAALLTWHLWRTGRLRRSASD